MRKSISHSLVAIILAVTPALGNTDCIEVAATLKAAIVENPEQVLAFVEIQTAETPGCACEIVKTAIEATYADVELVANIVETAILAAPDQMRIIFQCAIAVAPDALPAVQAVLAKLDPNSGESYSSKSAKYSGKSGKEVSPMQEEAAIANPLDFPGSGPVGPIDGLGGGGLPGGDPFMQPFFPGFFPTNPVTPPVESPVNPLP